MIIIFGIASCTLPTIAKAAVDPQVRKPKFDEQLMGQLIRFVSSHYVGQALGLSKKP